MLELCEIFLFYEIIASWHTFLWQSRWLSHFSKLEISSIWVKIDFVSHRLQNTAHWVTSSILWAVAVAVWNYSEIQQLFPSAKKKKRQRAAESSLSSAHWIYPRISKRFSHLGVLTAIQIILTSDRHVVMNVVMLELLSLPQRLVPDVSLNMCAYHVYAWPSSWLKRAFMLWLKVFLDPDHSCHDLNQVRLHVVYVGLIPQ